jgi:hypothetical protein
MAAAIFARLAYIFAMAGTKLSDDEASFWSIAGNIVHGHGFSYQGRATAWRPPLYTYAVAAGRWAGAGIREVQVGQAFIGAATPPLFYLLARRIGLSHRAALVTAWIGALYPPFVYYAGRILSENLDIPLYLLALWLTLEWLDRRNSDWAFLCGAAWGLAILGRPSNIPILVVAAAFVAPWVVRNANSVGGPEPVTSNEGITVWAPNRLDTNQLKNVLNDPRYPGMQEYSIYGRAFPGIEALARAKHFDFDRASEAAQDAWFRNIRAEPLRFVRRTLERAAVVLVPAPDNATQTAKTGLAAKVVLWLTSGPVVVLGTVGLVELLRRRWRGSAFLMVSAVVALGFLAIHLPYVRYRVDGVDPILIPAAAWLVVDGWRRWRPAPTEAPR